ncbi:NADH-cytochrome b5 reductase-like isoform X3 [Pelodiscus sinensis]|uniref:NADH-cytochrome b5 reductase-like isoform X3 n=1 Tax=Pelodiscus sinensis TaxID=13735 RepID=UPI0007045DD9
MGEVLAQVMSESGDDWLSLMPIEPLKSQCCGSGCKPCVYDVYQKELAQWEEAKAKKDKSLLTKQKEESSNSELNPDTFTAFKISSVEQLTEDTYYYKFELPENSSLGLSLGQHIVLRGMVNGLEIQRAYTPVSPVNAEGYFEVLIKYGELLMLASGTGIAPMLPILQYITENEDDETFITLVGCFRTFENIYLKPLLQDLSRYWNIRTCFVLSQEPSLEKLPWSYQENTQTGHITENLIKKMINSCRRKPFVLICGSIAFNEDMTRCLKSLGLKEDSYFVF